MATIRVKSRLPARQVRKIRRDLPGVLSGRLPDQNKIRQAFWSHFAQSFWEQVNEGYKIKSKGRTDKLGVRWPPLKRATIAQRPVRRGEIGSLGIGGRGERAFKQRRRGLLTESQDKRWRGIFASVFARFVATLGENEAKARAAAIAWTILKSEGAKTKLEVLGGRKVPILRVTDKLFNATKPGRVSGTRYRPPSGQFYKQNPKSIETGIDVGEIPYAEHVTKRRPILPSVRRASKLFNRAAIAAQNAVAIQFAESLQ